MVGLNWMWLLDVLGPDVVELDDVLAQVLGLGVLGRRRRRGRVLGQDGRDGGQDEGQGQ